jgi:hypothetical protein
MTPLPRKHITELQRKRQIPRWLGSDPLSAWWLGLAPDTLEFWIRFPSERNQGKQEYPVLKYRVPHGSQPRPGWAPDHRSYTTTRDSSDRISITVEYYRRKKNRTGKAGHSKERESTGRGLASKIITLVRHTIESIYRLNCTACSKHVSSKPPTHPSESSTKAGCTRGLQRAFCWAMSGKNSTKDAGSACCRWAAPIAPGQRRGGYCAEGGWTTTIQTPIRVTVTRRSQPTKNM